MHPIVDLTLLTLAVAVVGIPILRRRSGTRALERVVRCRDGHLFTSMVIPGASLKAVRLGNARLQRCPVGQHWTLVRVVDDASLTPTERALAGSVHDTPLP
jgi:hypothetical protein